MNRDQPMPKDSTAATAVKRDEPSKRDKASPYELKALVALNQDFNRSYPEINRGPAAGRSQAVHAALPQCPSRFELCRRTTRLTRIIHNSNNDRIPVTITKALRWIAAQPATKPIKPQVERKAAQAATTPDIAFAAGGAD
jgi:hypothetical protein